MEANQLCGWLAKEPTSEGLSAAENGGKIRRPSEGVNADSRRVVVQFQRARIPNGFYLVAVVKSPSDAHNRLFSDPEEVALSEQGSTLSGSDGLLFPHRGRHSRAGLRLLNRDPSGLYSQR